MKDGDFTARRHPEDGPGTARSAGAAETIEIPVLRERQATSFGKRGVGPRPLEIMHDGRAI